MIAFPEATRVGPVGMKMCKEVTKLQASKGSENVSNQHRQDGE